MERKTMNRRHKKGIYRKKCTGGKYRPTYWKVGQMQFLEGEVGKIGP
jgi:hypothetical protein